jgi:heat shock protein HslJ
MIRRVAVVACGLVALAGCAAPTEPDESGASGSWVQLSAPPLSPRTGAATAWTGSEALFLGGDTGPPCLDTQGSTGDCELPPGARDGAAFDPATGTWRTTAEAPVPVQGWMPSAVDGDTLYLIAGGRLISYDASDDAWTEHPEPPAAPEYGRLAVFGGTVVAVAGERREGEASGSVYEPRTRSWSPLPDDPLGPSYDRVLTATSVGLVLTGKTLVPNPGAEEPSLVRAALLDPRSGGHWTELQIGEQLGGWQWAWTGKRMVDPSLGVANGGEVNGYGRNIPMGGILDPDGGTWSPLPDAPALGSGDWMVGALGGPLSAVDGWVYDDATGAWTRLARPDGAPPEPGSAVWAGHRLLVLGGIDPTQGPTVDALSDQAWMWTPDPGNGPDILDLTGAWVLTEGTGISPPDHGRATISFSADGQVEGTSFCNQYSGGYHLDGSALVLEEIVTTEMACTGAIGVAEQAFHTVLLAPGLEPTVDARDLLLTSDAGDLRFTRLVPVPVDELIGPRWVLESFATGEGQVPAVPEPAELVLRPDGTFSASTACRAFDGQWEVDGDSVVLADYGYDAVGCADPVGMQDRMVLAVLETGFQATVDGDVLTLVDADDRYEAAGLTLTYRAR